MAQTRGQVRPGGAQARQKRQRRITRGASQAARRAVLPPLAPPTAGNNGAAAAAAEPAPAAQQVTEGPNMDAWRDYFFPQQPALWAFALSFMPQETLTSMQRFHPSVLFPDHYPDRLPPGLGLEMVPGAGPLPQLRPAAAQPAAVAAAAAAGVAAQRQPQQQQQQQQQPGPSCAAGGGAAGFGAAAAAAPAASADAALSEQPSSSSLLPASSGDTLCMCEDCCGWYGISGGCGGCSSTGCYCRGEGYCSTSPDDRMQPGKRIMWRGAIERADPVRRNLFPLMKAAAAAEAPPPAAAQAVGALAPPPPPAKRQRRRQR